MKKLLAVIGVLCVLVVGLATYNRTSEAKIVTTPTQASEVSNPTPTDSAGPVTVEFRVSLTFSDEQPAVSPAEQK